MRILIINHYAGSPKMGMEFRPYYFAQEWLKLGHDVFILAADFSHLRKENPKITSDFEVQQIDGIKYIWVKTPKYDSNGMKRALNIYSFTRKVSANAKKIANDFKPNAVIASSTYTSDNWPAHKIAKIAKAKYVYEVHDLWPLSPMELGGMKKSNPFIILMQRAENYAYKHADAVVSMLPKTLEHMKKHGLDSSKWHYIPNAINPDNWTKVQKLNDKCNVKLKGIKKSFEKVIAYTGSIGLANNLDVFIEAAKLRNNIAFVIVGNGPEKQKLISKIESENILNAFILDAVSKEEIPDLLSNFDFLYIGLQAKSLFRFGISPNKMLDYMMAEKPIIQAIEAGNNMVEEANCGLSIKAANKDSIVEALDILMKKSDEDLKQMGENGKQFVLKNHSLNILSKKFLEILKF